MTTIGTTVSAATGRLNAAARWLWFGRGTRTPWVRRAAAVLFMLVVLCPIAYLLLFRFLAPPITPLMIATELSDGAIDQRWVPLNKISANLVRAVIASEDGKFCSHYGFDMEAIDEALAHNAKSTRIRGASTISQQTAKNLFLTQSRTWVRKGIEAYFTLLMEGLWPKHRIMEVYLNVIEWGPRRFGAEAAAQANFHKPASALTVMEAARLAAILPNPGYYKADKPGPYVLRQSAVIAGRIGQVGRDKLDDCMRR